MGRKSRSGMSSGRTGGGGSGGVNIDRAINKTAFTNEGGGNWQLDIPGIGGGQILDETGGSRDPMYGRGGKVYSIRAWDGEYNMISGEEIINGSLNNAKSALKDRLRAHYGMMG